MAADRLSIRLSESLRTGLENLGASTGRSESEVARAAIEEYLSKHNAFATCREIADRAGLIGCIDSGVGDLSTNPKHMSGFGE